MKKVFLIILNFNGGEMTASCLKSLEKVEHDNFKLDIVVVDNGSTDGSVETIKKLTNSKINVTVRLIENRENLGFAEGNNVGIRFALENNADYVCLLNNDTRVSPGFLEELIKVAELDNCTGIVGGKIYFEKGYEFQKNRYKEDELGKVIWYAGGIVDWKNVYASHRGVDEVDRGQYEEVAETQYINGCLMLIKKEVIQRIGLFDKHYYLYYEENDFCQRAKKAGFKLIYNPRAIIWHLNAGTSSSGSELHDYFLTRNRLLFGMHWAPLRAKINLIRDSLRLLRDGRPWQKIGVRDYYLGRLGRGSWKK